LARRLLKMLEMDEEYEGNVEVYSQDKGSFFIDETDFIIFYHTIYLKNECCKKFLTKILGIRPLARISQLNQLTPGGHFVPYLMLG